MPTYERSVRVAAPLERVREFHASTDGLLALTPQVAHLRVDGITGPDGEPDPDGLPVGTRIRLSVRPMGVGPRQTMVSEIVDRWQEPGAAGFVDELVEGPLEEWRHRHLFRRDDDGTLLTDRVTYALGGNWPVRPLEAMARLGLEPVFRYRHRKTRRLLETGTATDS
ncbi:MAG: SRPBCC family protein [Halobacteriaceae archaeon]